METFERIALRRESESTRQTKLVKYSVPTPAKYILQIFPPVTGKRLNAAFCSVLCKSITTITTI